MSPLPQPLFSLSNSAISAVLQEALLSVKTIAVQTQVYGRLMAVKREGESFSKLIDRLIHDAGSSASGEAILDRLGTVPSLAEDEAQVFLHVVEENRAQERWRSRDLR